MIGTSLPVTTEAVCGWRIRFAPAARPEERVLVELTDPARRVGILTAVSPEELLDTLDGSDPKDELRVFGVPDGSALATWRPRLTPWWQPPDGPAGLPTIELTMPDGKLLWRPGRAVLQSPPDRMMERLVTLATFAYYEGELRTLERELDEDEPAVEADVALTHRVGPSALKRWSRVNEMTRRATLRRMRYTRLRRRLEQPSDALADSTERLMSQLLERADMERRLESADDRLEVQGDVYELANDRLSEYHYFRTEALIEVGVAILLLVEVAIMLWEIVLMFGQGKG